MKAQKIFTVVILLILIIGVLSTSVSATVKVQIGAGDKKTLNEAEEVTITIKATEIDEGEDGINTFGGKLVYDETIFEKVTSANFKGQNNWSIAYNDEETDKKGTFLATINAGATTEQVIGTLTLKVKTKLKSTSTTVQFADLSTVGEDTINLGKQDVNFNINGTVKEEQPNTNNQNNTLNIISSEKDNGKNKIVVGNTQPKNDNTVSDKKIPQTGVQNTIIIVSIITLIVIAVISFIKFKKNQEIK